MTITWCRIWDTSDLLSTKIGRCKRSRECSIHLIINLYVEYIYMFYIHKINKFIYYYVEFSKAIT